MLPHVLYFCSVMVCPLWLPCATVKWNIGRFTQREVLPVPSCCDPIWVFPKIVVPPNHPFFRVFHYFHHPFWGVKSPYFWKHPYESPLRLGRSQVPLRVMRPRDRTAAPHTGAISGSLDTLRCLACEISYLRSSAWDTGLWCEEKPQRSVVLQAKKIYNEFKNGCMGFFHVLSTASNKLRTFHVFEHLDCEVCGTSDRLVYQQLRRAGVQVVQMPLRHTWSPKRIGSLGRQFGE